LDEVIEFKGKFVASKPIYNGDNFKIYPINIDDSDNRGVPIKVDRKYGTVTIVGDMPELDKGVEYTILGREKYSKFGWQYEVISIKRDKPITADDVERFLNEVITKRQTQILLSVYPNIIELVVQNRHDEVDLTKTKGIKEATFDKIRHKIIKDYALLDLVSEYSDYGLTLSMLRKLYDRYTSIEAIKRMMLENPYKCLCNINRVGFKLADGMILRIRPELIDSKQRLEECVWYVLTENETSGSTAMKKANLFASCSELAGQAMSHFISVVSNSNEYVIECELVSRISTYKCEQYVCDKLMTMMEQNVQYDIDHKNYCNIGEMSLTEQQEGALEKLCKNNVSILAGFAGAGKTQTTKAIIDMLEDNNLSYVLYAPTGRASQVLASYTDREASTIHRGLGFSPQDGFSIDELQPLSVDVVIVDEASMIDIFLMRGLLQAIDYNKTKIMFVCDPKQLPSVGAGNCCYDMIQSLNIPTTVLTQIFRYGEGGLMQIATKIRNGETYADYNHRGVLNFGKNSDYSLISCEPESTLHCVRDIVKDLISKGESIDDVIILSPMNKGDYGTVNINKLIQLTINPKAPNKSEYTYGKTTYRVGDRVIQTKNDYKAKDINQKETSIFNGNIGTVKRIVGKTMLVEFEEKCIWYEGESFSNLSLGYCISIHKSQGSAFKYVILATPRPHMFFLNRNLLYVGVTRAKQRVFHITTPDVIHSALQKEITYKRDTFLEGMVKNFSTIGNQSEIFSKSLHGKDVFESEEVKGIEEEIDFEDDEEIEEENETTIISFDELFS
jgi:RecD/TraA family predicted helicase